MIFHSIEVHLVLSMSQLRCLLCFSFSLICLFLHQPHSCKALRKGAREHLAKIRHGSTLGQGRRGTRDGVPAPRKRWQPEEWIGEAGTQRMLARLGSSSRAPCSEQELKTWTQHICLSVCCGHAFLLEPSLCIHVRAVRTTEGQGWAVCMCARVCT